MKKIFFYFNFFLLFLLMGCGPSVIQMKPQVRASVKNQAIQAIHYPSQPLIVVTAKKAVMGALFGLIGSAIAAGSAEKDGLKLMKNFNIEDPSLKTKEKFLMSLQTDPDFLKVQSLPDPYKNDSVHGLKQNFGNAFVLDFKTTGWGLIYYPLDLSHYQIGYAARSRLLRLSDQKILWQGFCHVNTKDPKGSRPTLNELKANQGALLKEKIQTVIQECSDQLMAQFQGTTVQKKNEKQFSQMQ